MRRWATDRQPTPDVAFRRVEWVCAPCYGRYNGVRMPHARTTHQPRRASKSWNSPINVSAAAPIQRHRLLTPTKPNAKRSAMTRQTQPDVARTNRPRRSMLICTTLFPSRADRSAKRAIRGAFLRAHRILCATREFGLFGIPCFDRSCNRRSPELDSNAFPETGSRGLPAGSEACSV